VYPAVINQKI